MPQSVANLVLVNKTLILLNLRRLLDKKYSPSRQQVFKLDAPDYDGKFSQNNFTFVELLKVANDTTFNKDLVEPLEQVDYEISHHSSSNFSPIYNSIKEGVLYKQSDHLKVWNSRYFVLNSHFLHYYVNKTDTIPRMSLQMIYGIKITLSHESRVINGYQLYPFTISHPESDIEYHLAATQAERDNWITAIQKVINGELISPSIGEESEGLHSGHVPSAVAIEPPKTSLSCRVLEPPNEPVHRHLVDFMVPASLKERIDHLCSTILEYSSPEYTRDWPVMYEKEGVRATRRPGSGLICVRGESVLPYSIAEIFGLALNPSMKKVVDPNIDVYERGKWYNFHTGHEYMRSKGSWPTSPRDFSNGTHWRLLKNGKFLNFAFSVENAEFPEQPGVVRANLYFGAYVMKHVVGGTQMTFLLQVDIGGSVPLAIANFVGQSKPLTIATLKKVLDQITKGKPRPDLSSAAPPTYEGRVTSSHQLTSPKRCYRPSLLVAQC